jgi:hypothetical protein
LERKCEAGETDDAATGLVGVTKTGREQGREGGGVGPRRRGQSGKPGESLFLRELFHIRLKVS